MEQQAPAEPVDERRQRLLESLAKARAVRAAKKAEEKALGDLLDVPKRFKTFEKKRRKKKAKVDAWNARRLKLPKAPPEEAADFTGMSIGMNGACAAACASGTCVITGVSYLCGHPQKGGLQSLQSDKQVLMRFHQAKAFLARLEADEKKKTRF